MRFSYRGGVGYRKKKLDSEVEEGESVKWDWYEMQKISYAHLGINALEFWQLQPKDILIMHEGYLMRRKEEHAIHYSTLFYNRLNTAYIMQQNTKKKIRPDKLYKLPFEKKESTISKEEIRAHFDRKEPVITNGKLRGYMVRGKLELIN